MAGVLSNQSNMLSCWASVRLASRMSGLFAVNFKYRHLKRDVQLGSVGEEWGNEWDLTKRLIFRPAGCPPGLLGSLGRIDIGLILTWRFVIVTWGYSCLDLVITAKVISATVSLLSFILWTMKCLCRLLSYNPYPVHLDGSVLWLWHSLLSYIIAFAVY